jgi:hypothetical protein
LAVASVAPIPIFLCHPNKRYFTQYDAFLLRLAASAIQDFLGSNVEHMPASMFIPSGQRMLITRAFESRHEPKIAELGESISTPGLPQHKVRRRFTVPGFHHAREHLAGIFQAEYSVWTIETLLDRRVVAREVSFKRTKVSDRLLESTPNLVEYARNVADMLSMVGALGQLKGLGVAEEDLVFMHVEAATVLAPEFGDIVRWAKTARPRIGVILHEATSEPTSDLTLVVESLGKLGVVACYEVDSVERLRRAQSASVRYLKVSARTSLTIDTSSDLRIDFSRICERLKEEVLIVPVPIREEVRARFSKLLSEQQAGYTILTEPRP